MVASGSGVDLVVSIGPASVSVPDVVGISEATATAAITNAGLIVGNVSIQANNSVPSGDVISQAPSGGVLAAPGSAVDLVVSSGPGTVSVPDVVGISQAAATSAITGAGLVVGVVSQQTSNTVPTGDVISQDPSGGTSLPAGSAVNLVISTGPASVTVPDVVGSSQAAAVNTISNAGLAVGSVTQQSSNTVPDGDVISQNPSAGTAVPAGSAVDLVISSGPPNVTVPNVVGSSQAAATTALTDAGLVVGSVTQQASNTVAPGNVISQDPVGGASVSAGSAVDLVVSSGPASVVVPDVVGASQQAATTTLNNAGLLVGGVTQQSSNLVPDGDVISQNPVAGTSVAPGSAVSLVVSTGPGADTFSDEFDANSLGDWELRHQVEGTSAQYTVLDINQTIPGSLTIVPTVTPGWFANGDGPLIFKLLTGNFSVQTRVTADSVTSPGQAPGSNFNSAGLMARNPDGASGPENYIMLNIGRQDSSIAGSVGSETKTTVNSSSTLFLQPGSNTGDLILCRVGNDFVSFRFLAGDSGWTQTTSFTRNDLPATLQVGMVVNAFNAPADLRASFDYIRLRPTPASVNDCTP
jgi:beta-lactam-binding protein with PASTA domain